MTKFCHRACAFTSIFSLIVALSCTEQKTTAPTAATSPVSTRGSIEITAELLEVPDGAVFERDLYNYATVLKYRVVKVLRGKVDQNEIYVAHYNPFKPRGEAADKRVPEIGGNLDRFEPRQVHRMALEAPVDEFYLGGIVNKYFGTSTEPIYWAVWTDLSSE